MIVWHMFLLLFMLAMSIISSAGNIDGASGDRNVAEYGNYFFLLKLSIDVFSECVTMIYSCCLFSDTKDVDGVSSFVRL